MKPKFETAMVFSRVLLVCCGVGVALAPLGHPLSSFWVEQLSAAGEAYVEAVILALVAFFAFPNMRRADLVRLTIALGAVTFLGQHLCGAPLRLASVVGWSAGALSVVAVSYSERVRSATRRTPYAPFSLSVPNNRRRAGFGKPVDVQKSSGAGLRA